MILYISASVTSSKPQISLLITIILVACLLSLSKTAVYNNMLANVVNTILYLNLVAFATFSLYNFKDDITRQTAVAYTSTIINFILLVGVII